MAEKLKDFVNVSPKTVNVNVTREIWKRFHFMHVVFDALRSLLLLCVCVRSFLSFFSAQYFASLII